MGMRMPQADLYFSQYTDTQLAQRAQQVHDLMNTNDALFDTPPIPLASFLSDIVTYRGAMAASLKGSKAQTTAKSSSKERVQNDLRQLALYVNTIILQTMQNTTTPHTNYAGLEILALSGFAFSSDPTPQANSTVGIPAPIIKRVMSKTPGTLYILLQQQQKRKRVVIDTSLGRKWYQMKYRTAAIPGIVPVPAGEWMYQTFTSSRITAIGLTSGKTYDYQVAAVGGRNVQQNESQPLIYTQARQVVII